MTLFVAVFPAVVMFGLLVWREYAHFRELTAWAEERQALLDRIMSRDINEFTAAQVAKEPRPSQAVYMDDAMEAALAMHRRG